MKLEEAKAGRFIESKLSELRRRIVGETLSGNIVVELPSGVTALFQPDWLHQWTLLPPKCDSFEWQPETFPQWWTSRSAAVAFNRRDSAGRTVRVMKDGKEHVWAYDWGHHGYTQITEAEALALLDKPETFPQYWTTLDSSASNTAFVKRYDSVRWHTVRKDGSESIDLGLSSDWNPDGRKQITEAEALALLDKPEPVNPATRKVVLTEWYCWDTDGTGISAINWSEHKPRGWDKCHAIGTREIEVPL
jgi:hypothetical protein